LDLLKDTYSKVLGHKCAIERFLVVGDGGLGATLKRIPHVVTLCQDSDGTPSVKATQPTGINRQQLVEADQQYRREIAKKNAAKAAAMGSSKAKAAAPAPAAPPKAAAPVAEVAKRPAEAPAPGGDANKKARNENEAETLARMLVQGVVRVLQNRAKADQGALPITELEEEFKALWKVPFNLAQAGETDAVTFLQKWPSKVEVIQEGEVLVVQLVKKVAVAEKPKVLPNDATAPPKAGMTTAVKAGSIAKAPGVPAAAKSQPPAVGIVAKAAAPVVVAAVEAEAKAGPSIPKRAGGPTRPPASIEDFLWNIHAVIEAFGGPMPIDQLKEAYSKHLGHKCAIERFLVVGEGGLGATLKRIPHLVTIEQDAAGELTLKPSLPAGATKEDLVAADAAYRKQLQQKSAVAKAAVAASPPAVASPPAAVAPAATAAKSSAAPAAEGERDAKKPRTEDPETLARMLVQGVVRVLQNRQKEGKGPLPVAELEVEFKALWKVPFNMQQAGETDAVTFLLKWPTKVDVVQQEDGQYVVHLAKKGTDKPKAAEKAPAPAAPSKAGSPAASPASPAPAPQAPPAAAPVQEQARLPDVAAAAVVVDASSLPEIQRQAVSILQTMQDMVQRQEALVKALSQLQGGGA